MACPFCRTLVWCKVFTYSCGSRESREETGVEIDEIKSWGRHCGREFVIESCIKDSEIIY